MISVVIPTLNQAARIPGLLYAVRAEPVSEEVIVVDGGSADGTAEAARGETLLFLHADSIFPPGGLAGLDRLLWERPEVVAATSASSSSTAMIASRAG